MRIKTPLTEPLKLIIQTPNLDARVVLIKLGFQSVPTVAQLLYRQIQAFQLSSVFLQISHSLADEDVLHTRFCVTRSPLDSQSLLLEVLDAHPLSTITASVRHAWFLRILAQERLFCDFQPIYDLQQGQVFAYECLARGLNDDGNDYTGQQLIDGAIALGLTREFDELALVTCLKAISRTASPDLFFINLLPNAIAANPSFLEQTFHQVVELGISPHQIMFELTEVESLLYRQSLPSLIHEIQHLGFGIAIDDLFGNVSINHYFMEFRPDIIKIDRQMISGCSQHPLKQILVKNLVRSAHELSVPILAEGLEDPADIQFCCEAGIDYGQGFGLARPQALLQLAPLKLLS